MCACQPPQSFRTLRRKRNDAKGILAGSLILNAGIKRADVLVRRLDSDFADPLELNARSRLGVPGLVQAVRDGTVVVANALGSGLVEGRALLSFLPALAPALLGSKLKLPNVATWWLGQAKARDEALDRLDEMLIAGRRAYRELKNVVVWNKTNAGMGSFYRSQHELILVWKHGRSKHVNNIELGKHGRNRSNVWTYAGANTFGAERLTDLAMHPTMKPVAMVADAILDCSRRGDLVLDSFGGSGTTLIACERTGRKARLIEIDPIYCDQTVRRWQKLTGKIAVNAAGIPFNDLEKP